MFGGGGYGILIANAGMDEVYYDHSSGNGINAASGTAGAEMVVELRSGRAVLGIGQDFFFLNLPHDADDAFEDLREIVIAQRPSVGARHVLVYGPLAVGFINRHVGMALELADCMGGGCALVQQFDQFAVEFVNLLAPFRDVHVA